MVVLSHSKPFLCNIWNNIDDTLRAAVVVDRVASGSSIRAWDVNQDLITDQDRRHKLLRDFVAGENVNTREVATSLRPTMEAFCASLSTSYAPGKMLGNSEGFVSNVPAGRPKF